MSAQVTQRVVEFVRRRKWVYQHIQSGSIWPYGVEFWPVLNKGYVYFGSSNENPFFNVSVKNYMVLKGIVFSKCDRWFVTTLLFNWSHYEISTLHNLSRHSAIKKNYGNSNKTSDQYQLRKIQFSAPLFKWINNPLLIFHEKVINSIKLGIIIHISYEISSVELTNFSLTYTKSELKFKRMCTNKIPHRYIWLKKKNETNTMWTNELVCFPWLHLQLNENLIAFITTIDHFTNIAIIQLTSINLNSCIYD